MALTYTQLVFFALLIVAYGFAFYIMFHKDHRGVEPSEDFPFFNDLGLAVFKMFSMFMGELEFSDLYKDAMDMEENGFVPDVFTVIVYMGFLFMVLMVLTNLLNGLAVSDVAFIAAKADIDSSVIRLEMIAETESLIYLLKKIKGCTTASTTPSLEKPEEYWKVVIGKEAQSRRHVSQKLLACIKDLLEASKVRERLDRETDMGREFREAGMNCIKVGLPPGTKKDAGTAIRQKNSRQVRF